MLILSRSLDEQFRIGHDVIIKILSIKGKQVRIGVTAPDDVDVHREEIYQRIQGNEPRTLNAPNTHDAHSNQI